MSLTEIIINLIDNASSQFESIANTAQASFDQIEGSTSSASSSMEEVGNSADNISNSIDNIDSSALDNVDSSADTAAGSLEEVGTAGESASSALESIDSSAIDNVDSSASTAASGLDEMGASGESASNALESVNADNVSKAGDAASTGAGEMDKLADSASKAADQVDQVGQAAENSKDDVIGLGTTTAAIGTLTAGMELGAQKAESLNASFEKMGNATLPEAQLRNMVSSLTSATFPTDDALLYIKTLRQIGITAPASLEAGASSFNKIAVATGVSSEEVVKFSNSMVAMGMNLEDIPSSYNAIAYANANMVGGFQTYVNWMQKYDSTFKEMGLNVDQTAVLISGATKKFGGGRAAYTGLNNAIKESNGDLSVLEQKLGMQPGALAGASEATAQYSGKIEKNAGIMAEHTTWLQKAKAEIDKLTVTYGDTIGPVMSFGGAIGGLASTIGTALTMKAALATASNTSILAQNAETASTTANTGATNTNILSKIRSRASSLASSAAEYLRSGAVWLVTGSLTAQAGAENAGILARIRSIATSGAHTAIEGVRAGALWLVTAAQNALNFAMNMNPIGIVIIAIVALIAVLAYLYKNNETVRKAIDWLWGSLKGLGAYIWGGLISAWNALKDALSPVTDALGNLWNVVVALWDAFVNDKSEEASGVWASISEALGELWNVIVQVAGVISEALYPVLEAVWSFLSTAFLAVWETISGVFMAVVGYIATVINAFAQLLSGQITFSQFLGQIWEGLKLMLAQVFLSIISGVGGFAISMVQKGLEAGTGFVRNIINYLISLPGQAQMYLLHVIMRVLTFVTLMRARAQQAGSNFLNGLMEMIRQAPGKVYNELLQIGQRIMSIGGDLYNKARQLGERIKSGLMEALGIASPGDMYRAIEGELGIIDELMENEQNNLGTSAESLGSAIQSGFGAPSMAVNIDTSGTSPGVTPQMDPSILLQNSEQTKGILRGTEEFTDLTMNNMNSTIRTGLTSMADTNTTAFQKITGTTNSGLKAVREATVREVGNVRSSWTGMQTALVGSASTIKNQVTSSITSLTRNMATFWSRIQNPSKLVAGGYAGHPGLVAGGYRGGRAAGFNPFRDERLMRLFPEKEECDLIDGCFAGWDYSTPWTRGINSEMGSWTPNFSSLGNLGLKVSDFKNSTWPVKGNLKLFTALAEKLIGPTSYDFYYNGRYSNQEALARGAFNCWDGAEIMVSLARALGLNASMVHGYWGSIGHMAASVEGVIFDTTQRQNRGVWRGTPGVSFGPGATPGELISPDTEEAPVIEVREDLNLNLIVDLRNVPENMNEEALKEILRSSITDEDVIKRIVKNRNFQDILKIELGKGVIRKKRSKGV